MSHPFRDSEYEAKGPQTNSINSEKKAKYREARILSSSN
jgi:hypothetical protein